MDHISSSHYDGLEGFGAGPALTGQQLDEINKALTAGNDVNNPGASAGAGFPLRVESLERTLKNVTFRMEHIRLWKAIPKLPAYNTVEEHNEISSYGQGTDGFVAEGELPSEDDSVYARKYATIKFMGTTRKVSHPMTMVKPAHGNVVANETVAGTMHLLRMIERALFEADSSLSALQFDGFRKLITANSPSTNKIDLRGKPLSEEAIIDASLVIGDAPNYGVPTHLHLNPKAKADLAKSFFPKARYETLSPPADGKVGLDLRGFTSPAGDVSFEPNVFITDGGAPPAGAGPTVNSAKVPGTPVISTGATTPVNAASQFIADDAGAYEYYIVAHNDYGNSAPVFVGGAAVTVAAGDKVTFGVTPAGGNATKWYQLYRTKKAGVGAANARLIARIANSAGVGELTVNDFNDKLPFTTEAYLFQQNLEAMSWKQLAPFLKIPLATIDPSVRWMQLVYGTLVLYAPGKVVMFQNVGRSPGSVGV